jgi:polyhydroxyalkanoate synthesis regulator phasin
MTAPQRSGDVRSGQETKTSKRFTPPRKLAAAGLAAGLIGGGAAGMLMSNSPLSGAATVAVAQADEPSDGAAEPGSRRAEHLAEVLAPLVDNATISQEQADAVVAALMEDGLEHRRGRNAKRLEALTVAAGVIGIEPAVLADALRDGSTIAAVAAEHDVEVQAVIDAMVADASERLNEAVANGRITEEQASERLANLTERVADHVNNGRPEGGPAMRGHGPGGPEDDSTGED